MSLQKKLLVVTDLDATLLDHNYSWAAAEPAIGQLRTYGFPLVFNSSKTLAEMKPLASALDSGAPIVAENGGLVALPENGGAPDTREYAIDVKGLARQTILDVAHGLRAREGYQFRGFADWSTAELAALTGLSTEQAEASGTRLATEPIRWDDSEANRLRFADSLATQGIRMLKGGRFWHLMGDVDKADGVQAVRQYYEQREPNVAWQVVALGDSANDTAMLEAADIAVVIPHAEGPRIQPEAAHVRHAPHPASAGWNAAILSLLAEI
ncbi:MAG: HAD-IIB family hydrolase [Verrucomicrobia bacterium]|jgi:mannosyl-3-phosphoglycerate phosphatase|nr:HAD-IIB family hydrolase [Verrucomicrobiota bacterium]